MTALLLLTAAVTLACLAGAALFILGRPRDPSARRRRSFAAGPLALVATAAPIIAGILIFRATFLTDEQLPWLRWGLLACIAATFILLIAWVIGDLARGRRRCPKCWYDMAGTPGLTCPECGRTARHERALLRARRRARLLPAAFVPALLGVFMWSAGFFRAPEWPQQLSNSALVLAAPFAGHDGKIAKEVQSAIGLWFPPERPRTYSAWQRWVLVQVGRRAQTDTAKLERGFYGVSILLSLERDDETTLSTLTTFMKNPDPAIVQGAGICMAHLRHNLPAAKKVLGEALSNRSPSAAYGALMGLGGILMREPGGEPSPGLLRLAASKDRQTQIIAVKLIALSDPHPDARPVLMTVAAQRWSRADAVVGLASLWPDDVEVQRMVLDALRDNEGDQPVNADVVDGLISADRTTRKSRGSLAPARLALYTPEICAELEKHIPALEAEQSRFNRENPEYKSDALPHVDILRQTLADARRAHATAPASTPPSTPALAPR